MSVAWIGSQAVSLTVAIQEAAKLLVSSRCPVFSVDSDVHGSRSAIAMAERLGAAYDHVKGRDLVNEVALFTDNGGFFTTPGETRRRADMIVIVGDIPTAHHEILLSWNAASADLVSPGKRAWFLLDGSGSAPKSAHIARQVEARTIASDLTLGGVVAVVRALLAGRPVSQKLPNIEGFASALAKASFPVFVFSGHYDDPHSIVMLQGLIADLNKSRRATTLFLPADDDAWGMVLTSLWMTGFPPRTSFSTGRPIYDPVLCDIDRMLAEKEADLHVWISERDSEEPPKRRGIPMIALVRTDHPAAGAMVTIRIGKAGSDHDGVFYSSRIGTLTAVEASARSDLPMVTDVMRQLADALPEREGLPC